MNRNVYLHILLIVALAVVALLFLPGQSRAARLTLEFKGETDVINGGYEPKTYEFPFVVENRDQTEEASFSVFFDGGPPHPGRTY